METKSKNYVGVRLHVQAILARYGVDPLGKHTFCLESVMYGDELIRDHMRVRGRTGKGKGTPVKMYVKIGQYLHNGERKYKFDDYKFL